MTVDIDRATFHHNSWREYWQLKPSRHAPRHGVVQIKRRIFFTPRIEAPIHNGEPATAFDEDRTMIATPRLVRRNPVETHIGDASHNLANISLHSRVAHVDVDGFVRRECAHQ